MNQQVTVKPDVLPVVRGASLDEILPAINTAMKAVRKIAKTNENEHDKYDFASIDDFIDLVNPICVESGLIIPPPQELEIQEFTKKGKYGESSWLRFVFEITCYHVSGQSMPPVKKSVEVMRSGAQASGGAQSYALKQYMRALFQISTGDKDDPDFQKTDDGVVKEDKGHDPFFIAIEESESESELKDVGEKIKQANPSNRTSLLSAYAKKLKALKAKETNNG